MRLIDADAMKELWKGCEIKGSISPLLDIRPTIDAIIIPKNATNGDMIKALFPKANIEYWAEYSTYNIEFPNDNDVKHFSYDWWNAPY